MRIIERHSHTLEREVSLASEISELLSPENRNYKRAKYHFQNKQSAIMIGKVRHRRYLTNGSQTKKLLSSPRTIYP